MNPRTNEVSDTKRKEGLHHSAELAMEEDGPAMVGHVEEIPREFSVWSLSSLLVCLMATWEALSTVVAQALVSGGAPCLFYN
jgi:hypothetical protein